MTHTKGRIFKGLSVGAMLALCLALTGCVAPPDDIDTSGDYVVADGFQNVAPATKVITEPPATATPTPSPTPTSNGNWSWIDTVTTPPASTTMNGAIIITTTTDPISGIVNVTPYVAQTTASTTLQKGSTGAEVRELQTRLKELGYLSGSVDGDFGEATETAVKNFQSQNGLTVDGKAGSRTLTKLYSSSAVKAPSTVTYTPRPTATPTPRATATPNLSTDYYLEVGSSGSKVKVLQNRLIELGWLDGTADGSFGGATEYAVMAFQARYSSLWEDGVAGPDTLKTLYSAGAAKSSSPVASIGETLQEGTSSDAVKAMQKRLKELGFLSGSADGSFGQATKAAVIAFQTANGITADGKAGTRTLNLLYSQDAKDADSLVKDDEELTEDEEGDTVTVNGYTVLKEGMEGTAVKKLQQALKNRGYYSGSIDGKYGSGTVAAVTAFQKANGLTADGKAGPATQNALYNTTSTGTYNTLRNGDSSTAVKNMQYVLKELGYYDGSVDGDYGDTTEDAVRAFQIRNNLSPVDGIAGNKTLQRLYSGDAVAAAAESTTYTALSTGDKGDLVVQLQEQLAELGYLSEVTGRYDSATEEAVRNFQRRNGLSVDGKAGQETLRLLYAGNPKTAY